MKRNYYEVLEVSRTADGEEIKKSYRRLAMKWHPDRKDNSDKILAEENFKECAEAYAVLSNEEKRREYDTFGHISKDNANGMDDLFNYMRNVRPSGPQPEKGEDISIVASISLEELVSTNTKKSIDIKRQELCPFCNGQSFKPDAGKSVCVNCRGVGSFVQPIRHPFGVMHRVHSCPFCKGQGQIIDPKDKCTNCTNGKVLTDFKIEFDVPPGINEDQGIIMPYQGHSGNFGGPRGNILIHFKIRDHLLFKRDRHDIRVTYPLSIWEAVCGLKIDVPTPHGDKVKITVPSGIQSGTEIRKKGYGCPIIGSDIKGDLVVTFQVQTPLNITHEQKIALESVGSYADRKLVENYLERVKYGIREEDRSCSTSGEESVEKSADEIS